MLDEIKEVVEDEIERLLCERILEIDHDDKCIYYEEKWLDEYLETWKEYDWTDEELVLVKQEFENYIHGAWEEVGDDIVYEVRPGHWEFDLINIEEEYFEYEMRKIS